jgi:gamma-glutamylcyclotransferase (GGCT)/AIG2-like uncharacterized protein YtfP
MGVTDRLFVYGTLMRFSSRPMARKLRERGVYAGEASYNGRLYLVADYPGIVPSGNPDEQVFGEVFIVNDPDLMQALDRYEGCGPGAREPLPYRRVVQKVRMADGAVVDAWVYVYNRPVDDLALITSGRFETWAPVSRAPHPVAT